MSNPHTNTLTPLRRHSALAALLAAALLLLVSAPSAPAFEVIAESGEGAGKVASPAGLAVDTSTAEAESGRLYVSDRANHRVDVFDSEGHFAMAFGWGVADGGAEPQTCGPAAIPPTTSCQKGLEGGGAGELTLPEEIAVDNSNHDVYVLDRSTEGEGRGDRVEKFGSNGEFLLAWGGGVITAGAAGAGNLSAGSATVSNVVTTERVFEAGQTITAPGKIPAGDKIAAVGPGTITLSKPATASGTAVALNVAAGAGNVPVNEVQKLTVGSSGEFSLGFRTPNPSPTDATTPQDIPVCAPAAEIQSKLEGLANIGAGNVAVSGTPCDFYLIEFKGARFADTNVELHQGGGGGLSDIAVIQNGDSAAEICAEGMAESCAGGVEGTGDGQFAKSRESVHLAVGPGGTVYVADCVAAGSEEHGSLSCENRLQEFEPSGAFIKALALPQSELKPSGLAVDSSGDFYVSTQDGALRKYDPSGNLLPEVFAGKNFALALDPTDDLFVSEGQTIAEYDAAGDTLRRFGYGAIEFGATGLAPHHSTAGDVYVGENSASRVLHLDFPPPGPLVLPEPCQPSSLGNTKATLRAEVNPEGKATTFHFQYVNDADFIADGNSFGLGTQTTPESESIGSDFFPHKASGEASVAPETKYHCRIIATNADEPGGVSGKEGTFTSLPPLQIGATWSSGVQAEAATLNAEVNPLGISTTGYFEYVDEATYEADVKKAEEEAKSPKEVEEAGFEHATEAPDVKEGEEPIEFGAGESFKAAVAPINGLEPGTAYRYRIVATDSKIFPKEVPGPTEAFRTYRPGVGALPDNRAWELVSPAQKNSAEVAVRAAGRGPRLLLQLSPDPGRSELRRRDHLHLLDLLRRPRRRSRHEPVPLQAHRRRLADREHLPRSASGPLFLTPAYRGFSADLGFGAVVTRQAGAGRRSAKQPLPAKRPDGRPAGLTTEAPKIPVGTEDSASTTPAQAPTAATPSSPPTPLTPALPSESRHQDSTSMNGRPPKACVPSASCPAKPKLPPPLPTPTSANPDCTVRSAKTIVRHVISDDGTTVFWTYVPTSGTPKLLVRIDGNETIQLEPKPPPNNGLGPAGEGIFLAASADGSVVYFTAPGRLTKDAQAAGQLYRYDTRRPHPHRHHPRNDRPRRAGRGRLHRRRLLRLLRRQRGAERRRSNGAGEKAKAGADNLYLYHEGEAAASSRPSRAKTTATGSPQP